MTRADQRKFHYIYKITRIDGSGKYYIGMHSTDDLEDGYFGSGKVLWHSINRHGKEMHSKEILEFLPSRHDLKIRERELVNEEIVNDPLCMNLKLGGEGGWDHITPEQRAKAGLNGGFKGRSFEERSVWSKASWLSATEERRAAARNNFASVAQPAACIAAATETANAKRVTTMKDRGHMQGEKNSQFGTCWVTNGVKPIKIKKENLDEYLMNGYRRGRNAGVA